MCGLLAQARQFLARQISEIALCLRILEQLIKFIGLLVGILQGAILRQQRLERSAANRQRAHLAVIAKDLGVEQLRLQEGLLGREIFEFALQIGRHESITLAASRLTMNVSGREAASGGTEIQK